MTKTTQKNLDIFNELCKLPIKVSFANTFEHKTTEVPLGHYFIVKSLRDMNKKQLKNLFYDIGLKQVMKISVISTEISLTSITTDDFEKTNSPWRVILA